jgi:hypothetical protein
MEPKNLRASALRCRRWFSDVGLRGLASRLPMAAAMRNVHAKKKIQKIGFMIHPDSSESDRGETTKAGIKKAWSKSVSRSTPGFINSTTVPAFESLRERSKKRTVNIPTCGTQVSNGSQNYSRDAMGRMAHQGVRNSGELRLTLSNFQDFIEHQ